MDKRLVDIGMILLALALCLGLPACAHQTGGLAVNRPELFWPNPPEIKRIRFLNVVSGPGDLGIHPGLLKKMVRYIGGKQALSMVSPYGVTLDADGRLYVVDTSLRRVHLFDPKRNKYSLFPSDGATLALPVDIAVDDAGDFVFITDSKQGVVKVFKDHGNKYDSEFGGDIFKRPTGITINRSTSELLVVDTLQSKVYRFDLASRKLKGVFGGSGKTDGLFHYPTLIATAPDGSIIVTDALNFRVQVFSPEGRFLRKIGGMGNRPGTFSRPKGVAADSDGNIYVVDALFDNVQMFDTGGRLLMAFGTHGDGEGAFWLPSGICIDRNDSIYVSDSSNRRIQMFQYLKEDIAK
jgi:DNA-binding beta-propeller fold protein YncE